MLCYNIPVFWIYKNDNGNQRMYGYRSSGDGRWARWLWVMALLFLLGQIQATLHEAEFGADPHEHDGASCAVQFLGETAKELCAPVLATIEALRLAGIAHHDLAERYLAGGSMADRRYIRGPPLLLI